MERSRRQPAQSAASAKAKSALEQLRAAREGGVKRAIAYEVKEEAAVYDVVDDRQYAEIVKKRRDAGDFVVDDDGTGYVDIGEDDYWNERENAEEGEGSEDEGDDSKPSKKRKKEGKSKKGAKGGDGDDAKPEGGNITSMFRKAAANRSTLAGLKSTAGGAKPTDASSDDVLDSILGGLGDPATAAAPSSALASGMGAGAFGRPAAPRLPAAAAFGALPRYGGAYGAPAPMRAGGGLAAVAAIGAARTPPAAAAPQPAYAQGRPLAATPAGAASRPAVTPVVKEEEEEAAAHAAYDNGMSYDNGQPDDVAMLDAAGEQDGAAAQPPPGAAAAPLVKAEPAADAPPLPAPAIKREGAAAAAAPVGGRNFVELPSTPGDGSGGDRAEDVWQQMYSGPGAAGEDGAVAADATPPPAAGAATTPGGAEAAGAAPLPVDAAGNMAFYMLDAYENPDARPGEALLFGKVHSEGRWLSAAVAVRGLVRCLLVVPRPEVWEDGDGAIARAEAAAAADPAKRVELVRLLQERAGPLRDEVRALLSKAGVSSCRMLPVKRSYAFENRAVPHGPQWVLKVRYPANLPMLSMPASGTISGKTFVAIFGAQQSCLEALLLKRRIKGPGWLGVVAPQRVEYANQATWAKLEVSVDGAKRLLSGEKGLPPDAAGAAAPPLTVASLSLRTQIHPTSHQHEIVAASVVHLGGVSPDAPLTPEQWSSPARLRSFSIVRRLEGQAWPHGMESAAAAENASARGRANGGALVSLQASERSLLTCLLARMQALDADVLVGHNISAFDLTVLLARMQHHKVPLWSRIGRVKRTEFPRLTGGGHTFGGGAGAGVLATLAGRLLCDTYLAARELVKSVDFTLGTLSQSLLGRHRSDPLAAGGEAGVGGGLGTCFAAPDRLLGLLRHGETDAWLALGIMFHLSVLPLSKQLSCLGGQLWSRTLAGARAARIEMLLAHEFHARKFMLPDKQSYKDKQRRAAAEAEGDDMMAADGMGEDGEDGEPRAPGSKKGAKGGPKGNGPKYAGGLVLEPKRGLYDKIVIILDFNSLYPSIIQEYNICFTTVQRPPDGSLPPLPDPSSAAAGPAPLPAVLQALVARRRQVKTAMASERNPVTRQQLQVRQQALKLTANSMYGCLGFGASRFFAQPLAELVTAQGRAILQATVELVQGALGAEVIYGDTDSIMVATRSDSVEDARALGARIKKEVNKRYRLLEIELDGIFRSLLLLKKKKYAAVKLEPDGRGGLAEVIEQKGLDIVRRDWCPLSKDAGNFVLSAVLSGREREEVAAEVAAHMRQLAERVRAGQVPLGKFLITKQLTKRPEDYPDGAAQPHVAVALRRRAAGKRDGVLPGETVPYVICVDRTPQQGAEGGGEGAAAAPGPSSTSLASRARHPEELRENPHLAVDVEYYLAQQVHPVVSRLVGPLEGSDPAALAECLGLDPGRFRGGAGAGGGGGGAGGGEEEDAGLALGSAGGTMMDEDDNFRSCAPLTLTSPSGAPWPLAGVGEVLAGRLAPEQLLAPPGAHEGEALSGAQLANQVLLAARSAIGRYYDGSLRPDDETAEAPGGCRAGVLRHAAGGAGDEGGAGGGPGPDRCAHPDPDPSRAAVLLRRALGERDCYLQLCHFARLLDVEGAVRRHWGRLKAADPKTTVTPEDVRAMIPESLSRSLAAAAECLDSLRRRSGWHWVDLGRLFGPLGQQAAGDKAALGSERRTPLAAGSGLVNPASVRGVVA